MPGEIPVCAMTSGDIARLLDVDLKTIHNWVRSGHLRGRRTEGRHLRFLRTEVVRFMRRFGYRIPETMARPSPRILVAGLSTDEQDALRRGLSSPVVAEPLGCLFQAALVVAAGDYEMLVLHLERYSRPLIAELLNALRCRSTTQGLAVIGTARQPELRESFLACGGDVALEGTEELASTIRWLIGAPPLGSSERAPTTQGDPPRGPAAGRRRPSRAVPPGFKVRVVRPGRT